MLKKMMTYVTGEGDDKLKDKEEVGTGMPDEGQLLKTIFSEDGKEKENGNSAEEKDIEVSLGEEELEDYVLKKGKKKFVLSVDGGGVRGCCVTEFLERLELEIQKKDKNFQVKDFFDLFIGTSTGSTITGMLAARRVDCTHLNRKLYIYDVLKNVLKRDISSYCVPAFVSCRPKYKGDALRKHCLSCFGNLKLKDVEKPWVVTAYDVVEKRTVFLNSLKKSKWGHVLVADAVTASSSAPMYFPVYDGVECYSKEKDKKFKRHFLIDGGISQTNPAVTGVSIAKKMWGSEGYDIHCLSFGTGKRKKPIKGKNKGAFQWIYQSDIVFCQQDESMLGKQIKNIFGKDRYYRAQFRFPEKLVMSMDHIERDHIQELKKVGGKWFKDQGKEVMKFLGY